MNFVDFRKYVDKLKSIQNEQDSPTYSWDISFLFCILLCFWFGMLFNMMLTRQYDHQYVWAWQVMGY